MNNILLGSLGFVLVHLVDWAALKRLPLLKPLFEFCGTALVVFAIIATTTEGSRISLPFWTGAIGATLLVFSIMGLIYSLFINLPLHSTYIKTGNSGQLVDTGLYQLVRHPWLIFFILTMAGLALASRSVDIITAGLWWTALSVMLIWWQDRYVFCRMFPNYDVYKQHTPMLIPTPKSVSAFLSQFKAKV